MPHPGRGLRGAGVPQKVDGHTRGCQGGWECQRVADTETRPSPPFSKIFVSFPKKEGCPAILTLLLRHGAKVTSTDGHGVTPLGIAAEYGNAEALEILIQHGETQIL